MKVTGSTTVSQIAKGLEVLSGKVSLEFEGTPVLGGMVSPSVRIGSSDFILAIACTGAIADSLLEKAMEFALAPCQR